jgi:glycosyltransferase involved in cell wall biosynthesis
MTTPSKLIIFDTHPIQYRAPVFRELSQKLSDFKVYFFNSDFDGAKWWFHEVGKANSLAWGLNLTEGYSHQTLGTHQLNLKETYQKVKKVLAEENPNAVLVYGYYLKEHWILRILCSQLNIPLLFVGETFTSHSSWLRRTLTSPLQKWFLSGVKRFISIGKKTEAFYLSKDIAPSKIVLGHYCIDTEFFKKEEPLASAKRLELRNRLGIQESDFVLLFVGRLFERKRPQDMVALHESLLSQGTVHTLMIGSGPLEGALKSQCEGLPRLHWLGFQNQIETRDWYFASDLLVVPSEFETWGLVVNEAFSCGLPALVSDTCGVAEDLVADGETGFIFEVGSVQSAKKYVTQLLQNRKTQKEMGERARQKVLESYRPDQFANSICEAFAQLSLKK